MDHIFNHDLEAKATNYDRCYGFTHVIKKGDTLYKLSKQYNVKVSALILANPYVNIYNLQVGDTICIPRIRPIVIPVPPYPPVRPLPMPRSDGNRENGEEMRNIPEMPEEENISPMVPMDEIMPEEGPAMRRMPSADMPGGNQPGMPSMEMPSGEAPSMQAEAVERAEKENSLQKTAGNLASESEISGREAQITMEEAAIPACRNLKGRIETMTVKELLEEWDITYPMLASCLDIIKKM